MQLEKLEVGGSNQQRIPCVVLVMQRLREILEEEQEPFDLEAYLLEHGCCTPPIPESTTKGVCRKIVSSIRDLVTVTLGRGRHHLSNDGLTEEPETASNQDASASSMNGARTQRHPTHQSNKVATTLNPKTTLCPDNVAATTTKALSQKNMSSVHHNFVTVALDRGCHLGKDGVTEPQRLSDNQDASASSMNDPTHLYDKSPTDRMIEWRVKDENKQNSPDSVLDETPIQKGGSVFKKPTEDSILSASLWELTIRESEKQGISSSSYIISSKKALQQTRQLLFDCVREAVETQTAHLVEPESLGKLICHNNIRPSSCNTGRLLKSGVLNIFSQWDNLENHTQDIIQKLGDRILEQIMDELVHWFLYQQCMSV